MLEYARLEENIQTIYMRQKSLLNLYLQKVAEGDESYADRLCAQLCDRLLYVPVAPTEKKAGSETKLTFNVVTIAEAHRSLVPIFTTEEAYKAWVGASQHKGASISLLGADFCAALSGDSWVQVDPGTERKVELPPLLVKKIASHGVADEAARQGERTTIKETPVAEPKSTPAATLASEPAERSRSVTSTSLGRPVILSSAEKQPVLPKEEEQKKPQKRKSLLKYLKGS